MFLLPILIPACNSFSQAFLMMCSACRLNKQGDSRQPCCTPFSILNQSVVPYRVLTIASWPTYRFLRGQVRWSGILISLRDFHSSSWFTQSKVFSIVNETEIDVFLKFPHFLFNPAYVGNLISGSCSSFFFLGGDTLFLTFHLHCTTSSSSIALGLRRAVHGAPLSGFSNPGFVLH